MNKSIISLVITALAGLSAQAMANTGTITFTGELTANTCNVSVDGGAASSTVTLPTVAAGVLDASGKSAGDTAFTLALSGCTGTLQTASAFFEAGAGVNTDGRLVNTGTAKNVDIQLLDGSKSNGVINAGSAAQVASAGYVDVSGGSATLPYTARYYATGATEAGTVASSVTYNIQYK
ncbi:type 1 fimbrial protein [Enterobacter cloacae subsp. cloacae]|uniref:fimbrial protein n=1 Tax=Enterobacter cloacae TaxID=550 RepID=UPI001C5B24CE|nr:fimbrial protein [Enterobacter cloacae]MBW4204106.1 type 1 fimbrial protein [Enterobacter cloacae subsp. cloacae]